MVVDRGDAGSAQGDAFHSVTLFEVTDIALEENLAILLDRHADRLRFDLSISLERILNLLTDISSGRLRFDRDLVLDLNHAAEFANASSAPFRW